MEEEIQVNKTYKELPTGKRETKSEWFLGRQVEKVNKGQGMLFNSTPVLNATGRLDRMDTDK